MIKGTLISNQVIDRTKGASCHLMLGAFLDILDRVSFTRALSPLYTN